VGKRSPLPIHDNSRPTLARRPNKLVRCNTLASFAGEGQVVGASNPGLGFRGRARPCASYAARRILAVWTASVSRRQRIVLLRRLSIASDWDASQTLAGPPSFSAVELYGVPFREAGA
jgi:hypothetical protein